MTSRFPLASLVVLACAALSACSTPDPVVYRNLASAPSLAPNPNDPTGRTPFCFSTAPDWHHYTKAIFEQVAVYQGPDHQFGTMSEDDKAKLAFYAQERFNDALAQRFQLASLPGPGTLRIKLTLTGADTNTPVLSTLTRFDLAGGLYNGVQAARGGEGMMTGWVSYAVEIHDASTNQLLSASIVKQYPGAYNLPATVGALAAARTGLDKGAEALVEQLR